MGNGTIAVTTADAEVFAAEAFRNIDVSDLSCDDVADIRVAMQTAFDRLATRAAPPAMDREAVARIVNPSAFTSRRSLYDYCISQGDTEEDARRIADDTHKPDCDKALAKADAILSTLSADAIRQVEGETLALRAIKAVTATAKDGAAGLSRIMAIASAAGVKQQYSELLQDPYVALIVDRPRTEWAHLFKPGVEGCAIPPEGWQCSRARGHSGPCAATPASHASDGGTSNA